MAANDTGPLAPADGAPGLAFRLALAVAYGLILASLVAMGINVHNGGRLAVGAPLARLDDAQLLTVRGTRGGYDPLLAVSRTGALQAVVTERGGSCVVFGPGLVQTSPVAIKAPVSAVPDSVRAAPYCAAAPLASGALAFAAISPSGAISLGTLDSSGGVTNGATLRGPTIVFGAMWLTATPSGVYLVAETRGSGSDCCGITVWHSHDGVTYEPGTTLPQPPRAHADPATFAGSLSVDPATTAGGASHERLYLPFTHAATGSPSEHQLWLAVSDDGGATWTDRLLIDNPVGTTVAAQYPAAAVDAAGNVYVTWSDLGRIWYVWSKDEGERLAGLQQVSDQAGMNVMPAIVAGDDGHIAIAWYAGTGAAVMGDGSPNDEWRPVLAISGNADGPSPALTRHSLSGSAVHRGSICLLGAGCADKGDGGPFDPRLGVHMGLAVDPSSGGLAVAYAADSDGTAEPDVRVVRLHCGERLIVDPPKPLPSCG